MRWTIPQAWNKRPASDVLLQEAMVRDGTICAMTFKEKT